MPIFYIRTENNKKEYINDGNFFANYIIYIYRNPGEWRDNSGSAQIMDFLGYLSLFL